MYDRPLRVFVSSRMQELAPERQAIKRALRVLEAEAWVFEDSAGARSQSIRDTYLDELAAADLYVGVFWKTYGEYTADEFDRAQKLGKHCLIYEKRVDADQRDQQLQDFLGRFTDVRTGLTTSWFSSAEELADKVKTDVARWQTNWARHGLSDTTGGGRAREVQAVPRQRVVNLAPQSVAELFKDRAPVLAAVTDALLATGSDVRAVTVVGPGGVGKTALVCQAMRELEENQTVHGVAYFSPRTTGISFDRLYRDCARLLGGSVEQKLLSAWKSEDVSAAREIQMLLEAFGQQRCVLLLDNLEAAMDHAGVLMDADLLEFLNAFLIQSHGARLLITSREPLNLASESRKHQQVIPLEQGLPAPFAIDLLRHLDDKRANGELGLRDASAALLSEAAEKTHGYPTALEAIFSILSEEKQLSLERLLADDTLFRGSVIRNLVNAALSRLDVNGHRVMQALAVFRRPVREAGIRHLLEPFVDASTIADIVRRLVRGLYVGSKRATGELSLHSLYAEFSYRQIPGDQSAAYNRVALERRAAGYYVQLREPREKWTSIDRVEPMLHEFEHWLQAGDVPEASRVLSEVDADYLIAWGHARRVLDLRGRIPADALTPDARALHELAIADANLAIGKYQDAVTHARNASEYAQRCGRGDLEARSGILLGSASWFLGEYHAQEEHCQRALSWSRVAGATGMEVRARCGLSAAYRSLGRLPEAATQAREAVALAATSAHEADQARAQRALGTAYRLLGDLEASRGCFEAALRIAEASGDTLARCKDHNHLALVLLAASRPAASLEHARSALALAREIGSVEQEGYAISYAGCALLAASRFGDATGAFRDGLAMFERSGYRYGVSFVLSFLGSASIGAGDLPDAFGFLERGLAVATALGAPRAQAYVHIQLARAYAASGALDQAVVAARAAEERFRTAGTPHWEACAAYANALQCRARREAEGEATGLLTAAHILLRAGDFAGEAHALAREASTAAPAESPWRDDALKLVASLDEQLAVADGLGTAAADSSESLT